MSVPTNLIPTKVTGLPEYTGSGTYGYMPYIIDGRTYKVQFSNIAAVGAVPSSRTIATGTGLTGGGDLSQDRTISIAPAGVGFDQLALSGVVAGTYGSGSEVPIVTVDAKGRVISATTTPLSISGYVPTSRNIVAGAGLTGGGDLTSDVSLAVNFSNNTPQALGTATAGVSTAAARGDHVHPAVDLSDTSQTQGALPLGRGGTGDALSPVAGAVVYSTGSKFALTNPGIAGQVLVSGGLDEPQWQTITGTGTVTSVNASGGTTGLTFTGGPVTTVGTLTLGGTLAITHGGTGATDAATARSNLGAAASGANSDITSMSGITGAIASPDYIDFDTAATVTRATGRLWWDNADNHQTLSLGMAGDNVTLQIGEEMYFHIKASSAITEGQLVMFTGTLGASGGLTGAPATGLTKDTASYIMGVATENIDTNSWGYVTQFGLVRGFNTTGGAEAWVDGQILYYNPAVPGGLTKTVPIAPNAKVEVAAVVHAASNGSIFVRPTARFSLTQLNDVESSAAADLDLLQYNGSGGYWQHKSPSLITTGSATNLAGGAANRIAYQTGAGATGFIVAPTVSNTYLEWSGSGFQWSSNPLGTVTSVDASGGTTGLTFSGGPVTAAGTLTLGGTLAVASGGTGATTAPNARTNLGASTIGSNLFTLTNPSAITFPRFNADNTVSALSAADFRTAIGAGTGNGSVTSVDGSGGTTGLTLTGGPITGSGTLTLGGTLAVANGGTGATTAPNARTNLGATTVGGNFFTLTNPSAITFPRINADNTVSALSAADFRTAIGVGTGTGTVTSVDVSGGTTGLTFSGGPITVSGTITMAGTLGVANGGTGSSSFTSGYLLKGNGASAVNTSNVYDDGINVGVGTSTPNARLTVAGAITSYQAGVTDQIIFTPQTAGSGALLLAVNEANNAYRQMTIDGSPVVINTAGTEKMRIDSSGNVGIGTSSINQKLTVAGGIRIADTATLGATIQPGVLSYEYPVTRSYVGDATGYSWAFSSRTGSVTYDLMTIQDTGNVGIGATPSYRLHVNSGAATTVGFFQSTGTSSFIGLSNASYTAYLGSFNDGSFRIQTPGSSFSDKVTVDISGNVALTKLAFNIDSPFYTGGNITAGANALGIGTTGAAQVGFFTNNTERMRIDASGNVGIGTSSPSYKLQAVSAGAGASEIVASNTAGAERIHLISRNSAGISFAQSQNSQLLVGTYDNYALQFLTNNTSRMLIDTSGNVGIGTSSPVSRLEASVTSSGYWTGSAYTGDPTAITVTNTNPGGYDPVFIGRMTDSGGTSKRTFALGTVGTSAWTAGSVGTQTCDFYVLVRNNADALVERMRITSAGNVGIGTTSPQNKLVVSNGGAGGVEILTNGVIQSYNRSGAAYQPLYLDAQQILFRPSGSEAARIAANGNMTVGSSSSFGRLASVAADGTYQLALVGTSKAVRMRSDTTNFKIEAVDQTLSSSYEPLWLGGSLIQFGTSTSERMRLDASGNVLVGTTTAGSPGLAVGVGYNISFPDGGAGQSLATVFRQSSTGDLVLGSGVAYTSTPNGFASSYSSGWARSAINIGYGAIKFYTAGLATVAAGTDTTLNERMRITSAGNIGIGATGPSYKLDVAGQARAYNTASTYGELQLLAQYTGTAGPLAVGQGSDSTGYVVNTANAALVFGNNGTERMRIDTSGRVGIATSPSTHRLEVNGNVLTFIGQSYYCYTADYGLGTPDSNGLQLFTGSGDTLRFGHRSSGTFTERMRITGGGNILVGTTSEGWFSGAYAMRLKTGSVWTYDATSNNQIEIEANLYQSGLGSYNFANTGVATQLRLIEGEFFFNRSSASGTAGAAATMNTMVKIDSSGNVGIGATSFVGKFNVSLGSATGVGVVSAWDSTYALFGGVTANAAAVGIGFNTSSGGVLSSLAPNTSWRVMNYQASSHLFYVSGAEAMRVNTDSNVGIGTSSPATKLDVSGTARGTKLIAGATTGLGLSNVFEAYSASYGVLASLRSIPGDGINSYLNITTSSSGVTLEENGSSYGSLMFSTGASERMRIDASGNVGIGITPSYKLDVSAGGSNIRAYTASGNAELLIQSGAVGAAILDLQTVSGLNRIAGGVGGTSNMRFYTASTERMIIDSAGNVGIGTTSPSSISNYKAITLDATTGSFIEFRENTTNRLRIGGDGGSAFLNGASGILRFLTSDVERFRITSTGGITSSDLADAVGYKGLPQNSQTTGYTLALSDMGKHISITTGNITIPANGSVAFPVGSAVTIYNNSGSTQTISITTDTLRQAGTTNTGTRTLAAYGVATVLKVASTTWVISGNVT